MYNGNFTRWMYRGQRPNWLARALGRLWATVATSGATARIGLVTLEVTGRTSGRTISLPLVMVVVGGQRYLASMLGDNVQWVKNVRAAGGRAVLRSGRREDVRLEEIPADQRAPILRAYLQRAPGARPHILVDKDAPLAAFEQIAEAYPTFRVASPTAVRPTSPSSPVQRRSRLEMVLFALSAAGVPIGIFALRRLGRLGGLLLEVAGGALFVRAVVMVAAGTPRRLRVVPRLLLVAEAAVDGLTVAAGFWAWVWQPCVRPMLVERAHTGAGPRWWMRTRPPGRWTGSPRWVARVRAAAWLVALALHIARMAIYISPGRGLRKGAATVS